MRDPKLMEARFGGLLESTPDAVVMVNDAGRIVLINSQAERIFGYTRSELVGKPIEILLPERYRGGLVGHRTNYFARPRARSTGAGLELYGLRKNGEEFPVEVSLSPLKTDQGTLAMSAIRDITARKKAEQKFHGLLESARDAIVIVNREGEIVLVNSQTEKLFCYTRAELLGQAIELLVPERFRRRHPANRTGYFTDAKVRPMAARLEAFGQRKDSTEFPVEVSLSPLETEEGTQVSIAIRDITERKRFEESLRKANRLQEQLRRLSRRILSAQEDERKKISRELHDVIAQTLTGINIRLTTLKKEAVLNAKGLDRSIARTQRLVEKSVNMVHQFARELRPAVLDDLGLIPALHSFLKNFTARTGVRTRLTAFAGVEKLDTGRRTALFRVAQEALTNVARHAQASRVEVSIQKLPDCICMKIRDDGKSFQVDRVLHGKVHKHLGLLGMKERLEMVGGSFDVDSALGTGTTIQAQIPLGKATRGKGKESAKVESL